MIWILILLTVTDGKYIDNPAVSRDHIYGFTSEQACINAGIAAQSAEVINIGRHENRTVTTYRCVPKY